MGVKALLAVMVVGSAAVIGLGARREAPEPPPEVPRHIAEEPWLSRAATADLIADDGSPGPLFESAVLGAPAPPAEVRARIAEFARKNHMTIELEVADGDLTAIRFDVAFSGCCGYEGADVLALRLQRPSSGTCCVCGGPDTWFNDWTQVIADTVHLRARVRTNRVSVRWEPVATPADLVARADALLGKTVAEIEKRAGDRWSAIAWQEYGLEAAFPFPHERRDFAMHLATDHGRVVEVSFGVPYDTADTYADAVRARFGRPRVSGDTRTWQRAGHTVTLGEGSALTFRARS